MSVGIVCPACTTPLTFHRGPVIECPRCKAPLPEALRLAAEASLERQAYNRPALLTLGAYASPGIGALFVLGGLAAATHTGSLELNGQPVDDEGFLASGGLYMLMGGALCIAIGVGLLRERSWARWLMVFYWCLAFGGAMGLGWTESGVSGLAGGFASVVPLALVAYWYLFEKSNVAAYYRALRDNERAHGLTQREG